MGSRRSRESKFQIHTVSGVSCDYTNQLYLLDCEHLHNPEGSRKGSAELRRLVWINLPVFPTYTEFMREWVRRYNNHSDEHGGDQIPFGWFFVGKAKRNAQKLDALVKKMRSLWRENADDIDLQQLNRFVYEVSCIIYGAEREAELKECFHIEDQ